MTATRDARDFPVVCVGGSAGGLDAYVRLLRCLPADMGVAIVIVNHLRTVATRLHEILPRYTQMPVELITEGLALQPNRGHCQSKIRPPVTLGRYAAQMPNPFRYFNSSPEVIRLVVMMYVRYPLSLRNVEDLWIGAEAGPRFGRP